MIPIKDKQLQIEHLVKEMNQHQPSFNMNPCLFPLWFFGKIEYERVLTGLLWLPA